MLQFKDLEQVKTIATLFEQYDSDYIYCRIDNPAVSNIDHFHTFKFPGLGIFLLYEGGVECEINFHLFKLQAPSVFVLGPNELLNLKESFLQREEFDRLNLSIDCLLLSPNFLQDLNLDLNSINLPEVLNAPLSVVDRTLDEKELELISSYFSLLSHNAMENSEVAMTKNIARSLTQALFYQLLQIYLHKKATATNKIDVPQARKSYYVQEFLRLVQLHYRSKRSINFYADKMCISPKYLSHIIKESTGRPAIDWIAGFVMQEAKNLLRFSHKNIQQVAYDLNFSSQSSFGKYFKHATGLSPSAYKKQ